MALPDAMRLAPFPAVRPSSPNPTRSYTRPDGVLMISIGAHRAVAADLIGVSPGDSKRGGRGRVQSFGNALVGDFTPHLDEYRARWSQPTVYDRAAVQKIPAASGFDIENRRDEWRLNLQGRSRWQHEKMPNTKHGRMRWFHRRIEARHADEEYSARVDPESIRDKGAARDRHWRADYLLAEPGRDKVVAKLKVHGLLGSLWWRRRRHFITSSAPAPTISPHPIVSDRNTGYRNPPEWACWIDLREPDIGYRTLPSFGAPDRKGVAIGFPLRSPFWDRTDYVSGAGFYGTAADKGFAAVYEEERKFAHALKGRARRFEYTTFAEMENEETDTGIVAAYYKLQRAQMLLYDKTDADAENTAMLDDAEKRLDEVDQRLFELARDGLTQQEIATDLGVSQPTVSRRLKIICQDVSRP